MSEIVTVKGVANMIYGTLVGAKAYLAAASHGQAWAALDSAIQKQLLITASRMLERQSWAGDPTDPVDKSDFASQPADTQPLQWPRSGLTDRNEVTLDDTTIPAELDEASYEIAIDLNSTDSTIQTSSTTVSNVKSEKSSEKVDQAVTVSEETTYFSDASVGGIGGPTRFPNIVHELIGIWLGSGPGGAISAPEVGDNDGCSFIEGQDLGFSGLGLP